MKARDLMTRDPEVVTPSDLVQKAAEIMRDFDVGFVPIVDDRESMRVRGVITDRDIAIRHVAAGHTRHCTVSQHMTANGMETVDANATSDQVLSAMNQARVHRIAVTVAGRLVGVIAQATSSSSRSLATRGTSQRPSSRSRSGDEIALHHQEGATCSQKPPT